MKLTEERELLSKGVRPKEDGYWFYSEWIRE